LISSLIYLSVSTTVKQIETEKEKVEQEIPEAGQIKFFIENCLEKSTKKGLKEIGLKGGYIEIPPAVNYEETSYWFVNQINVQPTLGKIKKELEEFINKDLANCLNYSSFTKQGFVIETSALNSVVTFERANTQSLLDYTIKIKKGTYEKEFSQFIIELKVPFRQMFETASQIINLQMNTDFKKIYPLEKLNTTIIAVNSSQPEENIIVYQIKEKNIRENEEYLLTFASKFGPSYLKKSISLQDNSNVVSTILPLILNSIDKMAKLIVAPGTTMNLNGAAVKEITIQQAYPENVTRKNVPFIENLDDSVEYNDITWNLTYPLYQFEPSGIRFNSPQRLIVYWDENQLPRTGEMGILYFDETDWRPLPSKANYEENYIYTDLPGWGLPQNVPQTENIEGAAISGLAVGDSIMEPVKPKITAVDCGKQRYKSASTSAKIDPGGGCIAKLIITIVVVIILIIIMIVTFGAAGPAEAAALTAYNGAIAAGHSVEIATIIATNAAADALVTAGLTATMTAEAVAAAAIAAGDAAAAGLIGGTFITGTGAAAATSSFFGGVGGLTGWGVAIAVVGGLVGGILLNGALAYGAGHDSITFTPTCDQTIEIQMSASGGEGVCSPSGKENVKAGMAVSISSQMKKCNFIRGMICIDCSVNCKAKYK